MYVSRGTFSESSVGTERKPRRTHNETPPLGLATCTALYAMSHPVSPHPTTNTLLPVNISLLLYSLLCITVPLNFYNPILDGMYGTLCNPEQMATASKVSSCIIFLSFSPIKRLLNLKEQWYFFEPSLFLCFETVNFSAVTPKYI